MIFINPLGEYPRHIGDIQLEHNSWQPGDELPEGWKQVIETSMDIEVQENQLIYETMPEEIDGKWYQSWTVRDLTDQEIEYRNAPVTLKAKLKDLGLSDTEISLLSRGLF
jgi:hypothetical protein